MQEIIDEAGLQKALEASRTRPVFLFKHSTTCPVSSAAYREVDGYLKGESGVDQPEVYLVKVIESRPVSNAIATLTGITHQSPQLILVDAEKAVWDASHYGISGDSMARAASGAPGA